MVQPDEHYTPGLRPCHDICFLEICGIESYCATSIVIRAVGTGITSYDYVSLHCQSCILSI